MRLQQLSTKVVVLTVSLVGALAFVPAQAADQNVDNIEGVISSRDGDNLVLRGKGLGVTNVSITKSTNIYEFQGPLGVGIFPKRLNSDVLVPGLKITVEPESAAQKPVAKSIHFKTVDLETLYAIQAALAAPQAQIQALTQELAAKASTLRGYLIQVAGYADAAGSAGRNQALSDRRAEAVVSYLQQECGVALSRVLAPIAMGA